MKVTDEQLDTLAAAFAGLDTPERRDRYRRGEFPRADRVRDLEMRYRWDLFWAAPPEAREELTDLKDSHIDTALRRIVSPLGGAR